MCRPKEKKGKSVCVWGGGGLWEEDVRSERARPTHAFIEGSPNGTEARLADPLHQLATENTDTDLEKSRVCDTLNRSIGDSSVLMDAAVCGVSWRRITRRQHGSVVVVRFKWVGRERESRCESSELYQPGTRGKTTPPPISRLTLFQ